MPAKELRFGDDARQRMARGASILARAVKATLGPRGRNVVMKRSFGGPAVTKDRRLRCEGSRTRRSLRRHGCTDGERSGGQDLGNRR